jgi:hypothetical protein
VISQHALAPHIQQASELRDAVEALQREDLPLPCAIDARALFQSVADFEMLLRSRVQPVSVAVSAAAQAASAHAETPNDSVVEPLSVSPFAPAPASASVGATPSPLSPVAAPQLPASLYSPVTTPVGVALDPLPFDEIRPAPSFAPSPPQIALSSPRASALSSATRPVAERGLQELLADDYDLHTLNLHIAAFHSLFATILHSTSQPTSTANAVHDVFCAELPSLPPLLDMALPVAACLPAGSNAACWLARLRVVRPDAVLLQRVGVYLWHRLPCDALDLVCRWKTTAAYYEAPLIIRAAADFIDSLCRRLLEPCVGVTSEAYFAHYQQQQPRTTRVEFQRHKGRIFWDRAGTVKQILADSCTGSAEAGSRSRRCTACSGLSDAIGNHLQYRKAKAARQSAAPEGETEEIVKSAKVKELASRIEALHKAHPEWADVKMLALAGRALLGEKVPANSQFGMSLQQNLEAAAGGSWRSVRYPMRLIAFYQCARFIGGKASAIFRRGAGEQGAGNKGGPLPFNAAHVNNVEPSISELKACTPPAVCYPSLTHDLARIKAAIESLPAGSSTEGGLSMDALALQMGVLWCDYRKELLGCVGREAGGPGAISERELASHPDKYSPIVLHPQIASQVQTIFFTLTSGKLTLPVSYVVQQSEQGKVLFEVVQTLVTELEKIGAVVTWVCSDGFTSCEDYRLRLNEWLKKTQRTTPLVHIFDYTHLEKNLRNHLLNKPFASLGNDPVFFSMSTLIDIRAAACNDDDDACRALVALLPNEVLVPSDKMEWAPVKALFKVAPALRRVIAANRLPALHRHMTAIAEYIDNMERLYSAFAFCDGKPLPWRTRLANLQAAVEYFTAPSRSEQYSLSTATAKHLTTTLESMTKLWSWREEQARLRGDTESLAALDMTPWTHLSTLVVENFFSIVRSKVRIPTLMDFADAYRKAFNLLVFRLADETRESQRQVSFGQVLTLSLEMFSACV